MKQTTIPWTQQHQHQQLDRTAQHLQDPLPTNKIFTALDPFQGRQALMPQQTAAGPCRGEPQSLGTAAGPPPSAAHKACLGSQLDQMEIPAPWSTSSSIGKTFIGLNATQGSRAPPPMHLEHAGISGISAAREWLGSQPQHQRQWGEDSGKRKVPDLATEVAARRPPAGPSAVGCAPPTYAVNAPISHQKSRPISTPTHRSASGPPPGVAPSVLPPPSAVVSTLSLEQVRDGWLAF